MTPALLARTGLALYGPYWKTELAIHLDVPRDTIRRWCNGREAVPRGVEQELRRLLLGRSAVCVALVQELCDPLPLLASHALETVRHVLPQVEEALKEVKR